MKLTGSQGTSRHDEAIDKDKRLQLCRTEHGANGCHHLKATKVTDGISGGGMRHLLAEMLKSLLEKGEAK